MNGLPLGRFSKYATVVLTPLTVPIGNGETGEHVSCIADLIM